MFLEGEVCQGSSPAWCLLKGEVAMRLGVCGMEVEVDLERKGGVSWRWRKISKVETLVNVI